MYGSNHLKINHEHAREWVNVSSQMYTLHSFISWTSAEQLWGSRLKLSTPGRILTCFLSNSSTLWVAGTASSHKKCCLFQAWGFRWRCKCNWRSIPVRKTLLFEVAQGFIETFLLRKSGAVCARSKWPIHIPEKTVRLSKRGAHSSLKQITRWQLCWKQRSS